MRCSALRRSYREGGSVKNETLGNLSHLPDDVVDLVRRYAGRVDIVHAKDVRSDMAAKQ